MTFFIVASIMVTIAVAALVLAPRLEERRVIYNNEPDQPCGFGSDMAWIAVKTGDPNAVVAALGLADPIPSNWDSGIGTVYNASLGERRVFVTPAVDGWVFVVGNALPHPHGRAFMDKCMPLLSDLSERLGDVQYFASYPDLDFFAWAKLSSGRTVRAFGIGDEGIVWQKGRTTREERTLGLTLFELRGVRGRRGDAGGELLMHPTHEHVMRLAGGWSLNPTLLDSNQSVPALGTIADVPAAWRPERLRKSA